MFVPRITLLKPPWITVSQSNLSRSISTTPSFRRQPPHDRQRYKRHHPEPRHSVPFIDDAPLGHLPRKPTSISGLWGSTDPLMKSLRFRNGEELKRLPSTFEKLQELYYMENNMWFHSLDLPLQYPEMLEFIQQLTRTNLYGMDLEIRESSIVHQYLTYALTEGLIHLNQPPVNQTSSDSETIAMRSKKRCTLIAAFMEALYQGCCRGDLAPHLVRQPHHLDERATVETFVKRSYPKELFVCWNDIAEDLYEDANETVFDTSENVVRYRIRAELAWQLRGSEPLKPFVPWDDPQCLQDRVPRSNYRPEAFGLKPVDCYCFTCMPHTETLDYSEFARSVAGYWSHSPFWQGDPCEFGLLGVVDVAHSEKMLKDLARTSLPSATKADIRMRHGLSEGLLTAFAWTSAQAYNQGFTLYNELTYPLAVQLLLIDDDHIQLMRYQLNSMTSLWKAEDSGLPFNVAWISPKLRLFQVDRSAGCTVFVNPQAISLMISAMLCPTDADRLSSSLRPYLSDRFAPRDPSACLIPNSDEAVSTSVTSTTGSKSAQPSMSKLEQAALEASKRSEKEHPTRLFNPPRPHPNEVYFFKPTDKAALLEEFETTMPDFGGQFGRLPETYDALAKKWKLERRNRQPRRHVQAPPRRWR
ncbi:Ribosomal protein S30 mitochondrial [Paragonimus heterotremus]|uniref:Ribosomal protein S30 mitochondrial n=1 Tax=Paragonimus heterotremus TaxID=100268 RepID=A0A8J4WFD7_9TREM|nr:Ribosomal protein S30 mitochondrial [Paragonimus heterotremus]